MSERQGFLVRNGLVASGAFAAVVLLMLFYATVSGAVDRASSRRAEAVDSVRLSTTVGSPLKAARFASLSGAAR